MHPYFFGDTDNHLYGVYDAPRGNSFKDASVLLCYPVGQEYIRSHWASRQLVNQLSRAGLHCMRFDYFGSGDSAGRSTEASLDQWQADVNTSLTELRDISGVTKASLVGLRFGATIAATAPLHNQPPKKLVLWDPVVNGAAYLDGLRNMHQELLNNLNSMRSKRPVDHRQGIEELLGFSYTNDLIADIKNLNLLEFTEFSADEITLVISEPRPEYEALKEHLISLNLLGSYQEISSDAAWNSLTEIENAFIATEAISAITSELTRQ